MSCRAALRSFEARPSRFLWRKGSPAFLRVKPTPRSLSTQSARPYISRQQWPPPSECTLRQHSLRWGPSSPLFKTCPIRQYSTRRRPTLWQNIKILWFEQPSTIVLACFLIVFAVFFLTYNAWWYANAISPIEQTFPEPIAKQLKRALYYAHSDQNIQKSVEHFQKTFQAANDLGISPVQHDIIGVKLLFSQMFRKFNQQHLAIKVLEKALDECNLWLDKFNKGRPCPERTQVLKDVVMIHTQIGDLYGHEHVNDTDTAHRHYMTSVEIALREMTRREQQGLVENEGDWMTSEAIANTLENLADSYEGKAQHAMAAPLYLRAITLAPPKSCHTAILMNNLASCLAQTLPENAAAGPATSRPALISNARAWAEKAIAVTAAIGPSERTHECDIGCAVATHNLGEFAEMEGMVEEARGKYVEAESLAKAMKFGDGVDSARAGLKRLEEKGEGFRLEAS